MYQPRVISYNDTFYGRGDLLEKFQRPIGGRDTLTAPLPMVSILAYILLAYRTI